MKISKLYKEIGIVAYPLIIMNATSTIMQFVDRKFLSMNSTEDVSAALPAGILSFTLLSVLLISTRFTSAIVSQYNGKEDKISCARVIWGSFYFALFAGIISSYLLPPLGEYLINLGNHAPDIMQREQIYFKMIVPSGGFVCISIAFCSFFSGRGKTWTVTIVNFAACLMNIFLDYAMIFGNFGFPRLGIAGGGLATTLSLAFGAGLAFILFIIQDQKIYPTRNINFNFSDIKRLISYGFPTGIQVFCEIGAFTVIIFLIGTMGKAELAATTIAMSINMISFLPLLGLMEATTIVCAKYIGKKKKKTAEQAVYKSFRIAIVYMFFMGIIFTVFPETLFSIFAPENQTNINFSDVIKYGKIILLCAAFYNICDATYFIFNAGLRAAGDTSFAMWTVIIISWVIHLPIMVYLILYLKVELSIVWYCAVLYLGSIATIIYLRFKSGKWKEIEMVKE